MQLVPRYEKAAGQSMIDRRPAGPINAFCRIPSKGYQVL
jgi:hypothetical protein